MASQNRILEVSIKEVCLGKNPNDLLIKPLFGKYVILKNGRKVMSEIESKTTLNLYNCIEKEKVIICSDVVEERDEFGEIETKLSEEVSIKRKIHKRIRKYLISGREETVFELLTFSQIVTIYDNTYSTISRIETDLVFMPREDDVFYKWEYDDETDSFFLRTPNTIVELINKYVKEGVIDKSFAEMLISKIVKFNDLAHKTKSNEELKEINKQFYREVILPLKEVLERKVNELKHVKELRKKAIVETFTKISILPVKIEIVDNKNKLRRFVFTDGTVMKEKIVGSVPYEQFVVTVVEKEGKYFKKFGREVYEQLIQLL